MNRARREQGAQRAGLRAVWMNRTASRRHLEEGVQPDAIVADFDELLAWIQQGRVSDVKTIIGAFWFDKMRRGEWTPPSR